MSSHLRQQILDQVSRFHALEFEAREFVPGVSPVPVAGRVFDEEDVKNLVDASLDFWLTAGRYATRFEREFAGYLGLRCAILCNSGSSANLLAVCALTSPALGERRLLPGDEVITVAAGFPTTVNAIWLNRLVPVFVDVELGTYNIDVRQLEEALSSRARAILLAHTLGNPFNLDAVMEFARSHDLWVIEDNCDALGSTYRGKLTGTFGHLSTFSFYPAHHITMGEGGCVATDSPLLKKLVESFRDWGRDCWCEPGRDNTCGKRFGWQLGDLPFGYDHKYTYSHIGYNLKLTDMQAAVGVSQLRKLPAFIEARKRNWRMLRDGLERFQEHLILPVATGHSDPSWFGFAIGVRPGAPFTRQDLVRHLESHQVATRQLFGGNLTRQPAYREVPYRTVGELANTEFVAKSTLWTGVYPGLSPAAIDYQIHTFGRFLSRWS